jgi:hypothetical protein
MNPTVLSVSCELVHLLKLNCAHSPLNIRILSSTCVPFTLTTVQVPNLALTPKKRITVYTKGGRSQKRMSGPRESCDYLALQGTYRAVTRATVSVAPGLRPTLIHTSKPPPPWGKQEVYF